MKDYNVPSMSDEELMKLAQKRVKLKQQFKLHLIIYILVNILLVIIFFITAAHSHKGILGKDFWPKWSIFGWGIGVAFHGFAVYSDAFDTASPSKVMKEYKRLKDSVEFKTTDNDNKTDL